MFLFVLLPALALAVPTDNHIVNGEDQDIAEFPWQGSYRTGTSSHSCGCVFVGNNWVLTAGHCGGSSSYTMQFGASDRGGSRGTIVGVSSVLRHPQYDVGPGFTPNDISVVTPNGNVAGTNVSPASIPADSTNPETMGWITGWGRLCGSCGLPTTLQGRNIPIISDAEASQRWGSSFQASSMIAVYDNQGGACNGDSGGPLSVGSTVYGLASWVRSGCVSASPSTYARVGAFNDWVCSNTNGQANGC